MSRQMYKLMLRSVLLGSLLATALPYLAFAAEVSPPAKALWSRTMGQSGLRRFYSTGADLGELVNRQVSYQLARRLETAWRAQHPGTNPQANAFASEAEGFVVQYDSLVPLPVTLQRPLFIRTLARTAKRFEPGKLNSINQRYDLGLLYAPSQQTYLGIGLAIEHTRADLKYVQGNTSVNAIGPRLDAGVQLSPILALGLRLEEVTFTGDNEVMVSTMTGSMTGSMNIARQLDYQRRYLQTEAIIRLTRTQLPFLPANLQVGGMAAWHYLDLRYESQRNSLGQTVVEPFGNRERLGVFRSGVFVSANIGNNGLWNPYTELLLDREIDNNMTAPLDDRTSVLWRAGLARLLGTGKRISMEYQHSQSRHGARERDNLLLVAVIDF